MNPPILAIPASFAVVYYGLSGGRYRSWSLLLGAGLVAARILTVVGDANASIAVVVQLASCAALVLIRVLPKSARMFSLVAMAAGAAILVVNTGVWKILLGQSSVGWDVTLMHRAFEAQAVFNMVSNPVSLLFGGGPGATVNLTGSPDAATLLASGRQLSAVDDVHLLTSWLLMKFGLLGLLWGVVFIASIVRQSIRVMRQNDGFSFDFVLLLFVVSAVVTALPAATFLFSNPLMAFCMGALIAREFASASPFASSSPADTDAQGVKASTNVPR